MWFDSLLALSRGVTKFWRWCNSLSSQLDVWSQFYVNLLSLFFPLSGSQNAAGGVLGGREGLCWHSTAVKARRGGETDIGIFSSSCCFQKPASPVFPCVMSFWLDGEEKMWSSGYIERHGTRSPSTRLWFSLYAINLAWMDSLWAPHAEIETGSQFWAFSVVTPLCCREWKHEALPFPDGGAVTCAAPPGLFPPAQTSSAASHGSPPSALATCCKCDHRL